MHARVYPVSGAILTLILIAALSIAGCTSSSSSQTPIPAASPSQTIPPMVASTSVPVAATTMVMPAPVTPVATASSFSGTASVAIQNYSFIPASITVTPGTTVTWTNLDPVYHTVTSVEPSPVSFNSPVLHQGDTFQFTFNQTGDYTYICNIHPFMRGTVTVAM
ncbi:cupredoxin domain-containing protein [Methanoregula sp.]|uniref:cupredoxin domain-containing protein n=3 Tax=Methanoregula sp. TaxID=2052170 RepID=UPI003BAFC170